MRKNTLNPTSKSFANSLNTLIMRVYVNRQIAGYWLSTGENNPFLHEPRRTWLGSPILISFGQKVICIFIVPSCLLLSFIFPASGVLKKELPHNEMLIRTRPTAGFCNTTNCRRSRQARSRTWSPSNDCEYKYKLSRFLLSKLVSISNGVTTKTSCNYDYYNQVSLELWLHTYGLREIRLSRLEILNGLRR